MRLAALFSDRVALAGLDLARVADGALGPGALAGPAERAAVRDAAPRRRREFVAGRLCARRALARLGHAPAAAAPGVPAEVPVEIPVGRDREPLWPKGVVGSLAHTDRRAVAVVARAAERAGLGVDLEPAAPLPAEVRALVLTAAERAAGLDGLAERVVFAAKECVYKALFPRLRVWLDFGDVEVTLGPATPAAPGRFTARLARAVGPLPAGTELAGRWLVVHGGDERGLVACGLELDR